MPKYINQFSKPNHYEHEILDDQGHKIGTFRLKPNRVLWKLKGQGQFFSVSLDDFAAWIAAPGTNSTKTRS